ncbi:hypothetical protein PI125_g19449 [Phytophthora idaei]|nr:hypothetical protein PI125_g19449 [Phytophthora idaei]KAG3135856.1 hypothetical protein PI126_g18065 [Phytophthora idaei]
MPNLVDLTESTPPPRADTNLTLVARRQEMAEHCRYNQDHTMANVTAEWVEHDKACIKSSRRDRQGATGHSLHRSRNR